MKRKVLYILLIITSTFLWDCSSGKYILPINNTEIKDFYRIINKSYDETWKALIDYSANSIFRIDKFEKASGLITLSFGSSNPLEFITGGKFEKGWGDNHFSGDYVEYLVKYENGIFRGKMNIVVSKIDSLHTKVSINGQYEFTANKVYNGGIKYTDNWSFRSGECKTTNVTIETNGSQRTICPTYKAENNVLKELKILQ